MNRRYSPSSEVAHLVSEVSRLSAEELMETYGIELDPLLLKYKQGLVYDTLYDKFFKTVREWAVFTVEQDSLYDEDEDDRYTGKWDDDE